MNSNMGSIILTYIKRVLRGMMLLIFATVFTSCDLSSFRNAINGHLASPEKYQTEIEDIAKYTVSVCDVMIKQYSDLFKDNLFVALTADDFGELYSYTWEEYCNGIDKFDETMSELWLAEESKEGLKAVLYKVSNTPNHKFQDLAKKVYSEYNRTSVIISDYQQLATSSDTKVWRFQELNTGIFFRFTYGETWSCEPEEQSIIRYLKKNIN